MKKICVFGIALLCLLYATGPLHAGAWTQEKGGGFYQLATDIAIAAQLYDASGDRVDIPTTGEYTASFYGEYGAAEGVTAIAYLPFFRRLSIDGSEGRDSDAVNGIADIEVGARVRLMQRGASVLSAEIKLGLPIGDERQENGLTTGDGEFNQRLMLQYGRSYHPGPTYIGAELGINQRGDGFSDELHYGFELGYRFNARRMLIGRLIGLESFENGDEGVGGINGINGNDKRFAIIKFDYIYEPSQRFGLAVGLGGSPIGRNVLATPVFSLGLFKKI
jgi:hypothetical protein